MSTDWKEKLLTRALYFKDEFGDSESLLVTRSHTHTQKLPSRALELDFKDEFADSDTLTHTHTQI